MNELLDLAMVGFGIACAPRGPAVLWLRGGAGDHRPLLVSCVSAGALYEAQLMPPEVGVSVSGDGLHVKALFPSNVKAVLHGFDDARRMLRWHPAPVAGAWAVHALGCVIPWPAGYYVEFADDGSSEYRFQFRGPYREDATATELEQSTPPGGLVVVRGPISRGAMQRDDLVAPGQTVLASGGPAGAAWVEVGSDGEYGPSFQRHQLVDLGRRCVLVSAQGPRDLSDTVRGAALTVAGLTAMPAY